MVRRNPLPRRGLPTVFPESSLPLVPRLSPKSVLPWGSPFFPCIPVAPWSSWPLHDEDEPSPTPQGFPEMLTSPWPLDALERKPGSTIASRSQPRVLGCSSLPPGAVALLVWLLSPNAPQRGRWPPDRSADHFLSVGKGCFL